MQDCVTGIDNVLCTTADLPAVMTRHAACQLYVEQGNVKYVDMIGMEDALVQQLLTC